MRVFNPDDDRDTVDSSDRDDNRPPFTFRLVNKTARSKPAKFDDNERTLQRKLIDGIDCLPGQLDLF